MFFVMESVFVVLLNLIFNTFRLETHVLFCAFREATGKKENRRNWQHCEKETEEKKSVNKEDREKNRQLCVGKKSNIIKKNLSWHKLVPFF